ncbi:MAG: O-antigen polymerase [Pirellulales bacterium]
MVWPDQDYIETAILLEEPPQYFYYPAAVFLLSLVCLAVGYFLAQRLPDREFRYRRVFSPPKLVLGMLFSVVAATAATFLYVRNTGGMSTERISDKRAVINSVDVAGDTELQQFGPLRQVSKIGAVGFLTLLSYILSRKRGNNPLMLILLLILFTVSFVLPFYSSNRSDVVWLFIGAIGIAWYHQVRHFWLKVMGLGACAVGLFVVMSFLRHTDTSSVAEKASIGDAFRSLILNRNGPSLAKTGHIINNVPDVLDYQYGKTIAIWLLAPIPRSIYPNKPLIHSGPIIGTEIYGTKVSGVPPGLVGEMYWNFHLAGTIIGVAVVGFMMGWIHKRFWQLNKSIAVLAPLYMFSVAEIGYSILGHSVGFGLFIKLIDFVMAAGLIFLCTRPIYKEID